MSAFANGSARRGFTSKFATAPIGVGADVNYVRARLPTESPHKPRPVLEIPTGVF